mmetsp:Transcript_19303/g.74124  ORF Transcript_19303/g.74124 Transcript_19303/m.74124 type:complete len:282 (-) Transcript_19303:31-876(-)
MQWLLSGVRAYNAALVRRPYATQIVTSGGLWCVGDLISQRFEGCKKWEDVDWERNAKMSFFGLVLAGPIYSWWYKVLDQRTVHLLQQSRWKYLSVKLLIDQVVFEPPYLMLFFIVTTLLQGPESRDWKHVKEKLQQEYLYTYWTDCKVWPLIQLLNFRYVPAQYQALVVNGVCVGWNAFLSFVTNRQVDNDDGAGEAGTLLTEEDILGEAIHQLEEAVHPRAAASLCAGDVSRAAKAYREEWDPCAAPEISADALGVSLLADIGAAWQRGTERSTGVVLAS